MAEINFTIIANPRTGSNHLIELLNSHNEITCHREVFHRDNIYMLEGTRNELLQERKDNPLAFLMQMYDLSPTRACGFKIFNGHDDSVLDQVIHDSSIKKIILYRPNFLSVYSSEKIAQLENRYLIIGDRIKKTDVNVYDSSRTSEKAYFDKVEFELALNAYQDFYKKTVIALNKTNQDYLLLNYEDYINEYFFRRTFSFLGLFQPDEVHTRMRKLNSSDILSRFTNPNEVKIYIEKIGRMNWAYEGFMLWDNKSFDR